MTRLWLPSVHGNVEVTGQAEPPTRAEQFTAWWLYRLGDKRSAMRHDARLATAAQRQADWLAVNDFVPGAPHVGENGLTANERVRATGYALPDWWPEQENLVESVTRNWSEDIASIVDSLMAHSTHHDHMHVVNWYAEHTVYGVGQATEYFVVVSAPPESE